ncbi:MAG TPA: hypothetical protein VJR46_13640 [Candidatus Dormibacteraeota bacterium]|nr:hypothetical protein [Candidatus Dormibacteraeota bacterium]
MRWLLVVAAGFLFWLGWFVLGFLGEPSVVGNLRVGLIAVIAGSFALSLVAGLAGAWMLVARHT